MRYIIAGYTFVLLVLALYAVQLAWRRRRLARAVARVTGGDAASADGTGSMAGRRLQEPASGIAP
jgi:hypothetical protein